MGTKFERMVDCVLRGEMVESAAIQGHYYYTVHYPWGAQSDPGSLGHYARSRLLRLVEKLRARRVQEVACVQEVAPPGWESRVKKMKRKRGISNPYALAWWMHNQKKGRS